MNRELVISSYVIQVKNGRDIETVPLSFREEVRIRLYKRA